jgi:hypothetical protein
VTQLDEAPRIKNPLKGKGIGRPRDSKNKTSSGKPQSKPTSSQSLPQGTDTRDPSLFDRNLIIRRVGQTPQIQPAGNDSRVTKTQLSRVASTQLAPTPQVTQDSSFAYKDFRHINAPPSLHTNGAILTLLHHSSSNGSQIADKEAPTSPFKPYHETNYTQERKRHTSSYLSRLQGIRSRDPHIT